MRLFSALLVILSLLTFSVSAQEQLRTNITFESGEYTMHGELLLPVNRSNIPMIIFLVGAGENSSHRTLYKEFVEQNIEALFIEEGYGILYFDKRGVGESDGKWQRSGIYDRADDTKAAVNYLKSLDVVDSNRIGIVGHSQGGWVAQVVGSLYAQDVKAIASLAAPVFDTELHLTNIYYSEYICEGESEDKAFDKATKKAKSDINWVTWFPLKKAWRHLREISEFDPSSSLRRLSIPSLFVFADNDHMVYPGWALNSMNEIFDNNIPSHFTISVVPNANHDFKNIGMCASQEDIDSALYSDYFKTTFKSWILRNL